MWWFAYRETVVPGLIRVRRPLPEFGPCCARVSRPVQLGVGPPRVQGCRNKSAGLLNIHAQASKAKVQVAARHGGDVLPGASGNVVAVNGAQCAVIWAGTVGVSEIQRLLCRLKLALVGEVCLGLAGDGSPSGASIVGHINRRRDVVSGSNKDARCGAVGKCRSRIKRDKGQADDVSIVSANIAGVGDICSGVGKGRDLGEGHAAVGALPQTVATPSTKEENLGVAGVHGQPLAHAAARHVASHLEGEVCYGPRRSLVGTPNDGTRVGVPAVGVHACSSIDLVRILGIESEGVNTPVAPITRVT